ncbi:MAG: SH3 domain-containing protein [Clostridia bacterium]|jgi:uncharacterized protein YgiM (DUF1202 family)|nr:SH3 domain-containing protein [Clostridia bacterium]
MKKSVVISLLTIVSLCCTAICSFASTGVVTTDNLRLRKEPSTDSSTIAYLSASDKVEILGEDGFGWYKVKSGEYVGYVAAQYINVLDNSNSTNKDTNNQTDENTNTNAENQSSEENSQEQNNNQTVLASGEKIYITPVINSLVIDTLEKEKEIEIISEVNGWSYVKIGTQNRMG